MRRALAVLAVVAPARALAEGGAFAVPDTPAFHILDVSPEEIAEPGSARDFGLGLSNAVTFDGHVLPGYAVDVRPWYLVPGLAVPLPFYRTFLGFVLANAQLSLATAASDEDATDFAGGLRLTLFDAGDPMRDVGYTTALGTAMQQACSPLMVPGVSPEALEGCLDGASQSLREKWEKDHWNAARVGLASAVAFRAPGSNLADTEFHATSVWLAAVFPIGRHFQLQGQATFDRKTVEGPIDSDSDAPTEDFSQVGGGARFVGGVSWFHAFAEATGSLRLGVGDADAEVGTLAGGAELRLWKQMWLAASFGDAISDDEAPEGKVLVGLRWTVSDDARYDMER